MTLDPTTFIFVILATFIFGYLVGDRPRLPSGWRWVTYEEGRTLALYNDRVISVIEIHQINFLYWHVGSEKFKSLAKAKRHALRMVR